MKRFTILAVLAITCTLFAALPEAHAVSVFVVNSAADIGDNTPDGACDLCTLREAIQEANANGNPDEQDVIAFGFAGAGPHVIATSASGLPPITEAVLVDGYSQPGAIRNSATTGTNAVMKVRIDGTATAGIVSGLTVDTSNTTIRGLNIAEFSGPGLRFDSGTGNVAAGNFVGTDAAGNASSPNRDGVAVSDAVTGLRVGGSALADRNLISGNDAVGAGSGINAFSSGSKNVTIANNLIGTEADGVSDLGNGGHGILARIGPGSNWLIGGPDGGNVITSSDANGVLGFVGGNRMRILGNSIHSNGELGIDHDDNGVTENDIRDRDNGTNRAQNFPTITSAVTTTNTLIKGKFAGAPGRRILVQFFSSQTADPSGNGEGEVFLGEKRVTTNTAGRAAFSFTTSSPVSAGHVITATATDLRRRDTSEFSDAVTVT